MQPMLTMEHIGKGFPGVQALDNVEFTVYPGKIIGFLGKNGVGKSTLIKILSGVHPKDSGTIRFNSQEISPTVRKRHKIWVSAPFIRSWR